MKRVGDTSPRTGKRAADLVQDLAVGRSEHRGGRGVAPGRGERLRAGEREPDRDSGAAALGRRQQLARGNRRGRARRAARRPARRGSPATTQPGTEQPDALKISAHRRSPGCSCCRRSRRNSSAAPQTPRARLEHVVAERGSGRRVCALPGTRPCRSASMETTASVIPAAPSRCPVAPLVELHGVAGAEDLDHSLVLGRVVGGGRRAVQVHVIDIRCAETRRLQCALHGEARAQALGVRRGHVMSIGARLRRAARAHRERRRRRAFPAANPAPSPSEIPSRPASKGRQGWREVSSSARKPYNVVRQSESAPPTTAASHAPAAIMRAALPNTLAWTSRPRRRRTKDRSGR